MKPRGQLVFGVINSLTIAFSTLAMAPVYLRYLGVEVYGLIGFYTTLLLCVQVFDMGMATTLNREVARHGEGFLNEENARLLRNVEWIYLAVSIVLVLVMWSVGGWLAQQWFTAKSLSSSDITFALYGIGVSIAIRLPINVYQGVLFGAQKMHVVSLISIVQIIFGALGAYLLMRFYKADIVIFFIWQICTALLHLLCIRTLVLQGAPKLTQRTEGLQQLMSLWRYSLGVGLVSIAGLVLSQVDKVVLSKTLDLEHYGYYMLATSLAASIHIVVGPFYNLFFPIVNRLVASKRHDELLTKYQFYSSSLASCIFPLVLYFLLFLPQLLALWIHDSQAIVQITPIASLLIFASGTHAMMHLPHALMMAHGVSKAYLLMYLVLILLSLPITAFLSLQHGAIGGAIGQIVLFFTYASVGTWITHRYCLKGYAFKWLFRDIGRPFVIVVFFAYLASVLNINAHSSFSLSGFISSFFSLLFVFSLCILVGPSTREFLFINMKNLISKRLERFF